MKPSLLFLIATFLLGACSECPSYKEQKERPFQKMKLRKHTIAVDFESFNTFRYKDYLIITGYGRNFRFSVFDLDHQRMDRTFQRKVYHDSLVGLMVRNDELYGYFGADHWKRWQHGKWMSQSSEYDYFFGQIASRHYQNNLVYLQEDADYFIYGIDIGEFGGSVLFRDKRTKKTYSFQQRGPVDVLKTSEGYAVSMSVPHFEGFVSIAVIRDPRELEVVPDSLDMMKHACKARSIYDFWEMNHRRCSAPGLVLSRYLTDELNLNQKAYLYYNDQQKNDPNINFQLDSMGYGSNFLCVGSFGKNHKMTYLLMDSTLFFAQFNDQKLQVVQRFPAQKQLPYKVISHWHEGDGAAFGLKKYVSYEENGLPISTVWLQIEQNEIHIYSIVNDL